MSMICPPSIVGHAQNVVLEYHFESNRRRVGVDHHVVELSSATLHLWVVRMIEQPAASGSQNRTQLINGGTLRMELYVCFECAVRQWIGVEDEITHADGA